jgi:hypothetical protein
MHTPVSPHTPDHNDARMPATGADGAPLGRRHPLKPLAAGLAMVTLLGAAGCGITEDTVVK